MESVISSLSSEFTATNTRTDAGTTLATVSETITDAGTTLATVTSATGTASSLSGTATNTASNAASNTNPANSTSNQEGGTNVTSLSSGAKIGIGVAVPVIVILVAAIVGIFLIRRRRRKRDAQRQDEGTRPDDPTPEQHSDFHYQKPELEAAPVIDPTIRGPVKPKAELRTQGTKKSKAHGQPDGATDAVEAPLDYQPWHHDSGSDMPPELHPDSTLEIGAGSLTEQQMRQLKQQTTVGSEVSGSSSTAVQSSSGQSPLQLQQTVTAEASELAEEADVIVQELGLVNLRKKALATQAAASGVSPGDVEGRKGDEYRELLQREARLKGRLDEIESQR